MGKRLVLLALTAVVALSSPQKAEARRSCGSGKIYRVSMGICVGARSRLAWGFVRARRTIRYGHRYRHSFPRYHVASLQQEEEDQATSRDTRRARPKPLPGPARHHHDAPPMLEVIEAPPPPEDPAVEVPYVIQGSTLMRTPLKTFDWIKP